MADRLQYQAPTIYTDRAAEVNFDDGTADLMRNLSGAFLDVAEKAHQNELKKNVEQAKIDGALAGQEQGAAFKPVKSRGLVHRTYNDSGIQSATVKMSIKSQEAVQRIALSAPGNPELQQMMMKKWSDAYASDLPAELRVPFKQNFDQLALSQLTAANKDLNDVRQSEAIASFNDFESTIMNSVELTAPRMFEAGDVGATSARSIETLRKNYIEMLAQNGPAAEYQVGGYIVPAATGRSGAMDVEEIGAKIKEFDKGVLGAAVKGNFLKELEAGNGVANYFNFVKGKTALTSVDVDGNISQQLVDDILEDEDKEKLATFMRTHISALNSIEAAEDRKEDRARDKYNESVIDQALQQAFSTETLSDGTEVVVGNPDIIRGMYINAVNDETGLVRQETIETLQSMMETIGSGDITDPVVTSKTKLGIIDRSIKSAGQLPQQGLGDKERAESIELLRKVNAGQHWSNSQRYTTMLDLGKAALAPEAATGFTLFGDPNKESAADFAEFKERLMQEVISAEKSGTLPGDINALPADGEFDVQARAQAIIKDIQERRAKGNETPEMNEINSQIKEASDKIKNATSDDEAKKAASELKRLNDEKARLQTNQQLYGR